MTIVIFDVYRCKIYTVSVMSHRWQFTSRTADDTTKDFPYASSMLVPFSHVHDATLVVSGD